MKILEQFKSHRNSNGYIDATGKAKSIFKDTSVDILLYGDFYSIPKFGKTKLGQMVLYAKQSQNRELINELAIMVKPTIEKIIEKFKIDAVAFIPPPFLEICSLWMSLKERLILICLVLS